MKTDQVPVTVLSRYGLEGAGSQRLSAGLINATYLVSCDDGQRFVAQRVNPIFPPAVHDDIEAVTRHLARRGLLTPRLVHATDGALYVIEHDACWRLLTFVDGETRLVARDADQLVEAGGLLGRFHGALADLQHRFFNARPGVHDTSRHLARLRSSLSAADAPQHRLRQMEPLAHEILEAAGELPALPALPTRVVHGDPKLSNILFRRGNSRALCLIDLDTVNRMPLPLELGDAFRSWCNPAGENSGDADFRADWFAAAMNGYARYAPTGLTQPEIDALLPGTLTIAVELAARFCRDAIFEDYFSWDPEHFESHAEHSRVRAMGQLALARSIRAQWSGLARIAGEALGERRGPVH